MTHNYGSFYYEDDVAKPMAVQFDFGCLSLEEILQEVDSVDDILDLPFRQDMNQDYYEFEPDALHIFYQEDGKWVLEEK